MHASRVTQKYQATIPAEIRKMLDLHSGDLIGFEIHEHQILLKKVSPLDLEFAKALESTLTEWNSLEDDKLYTSL